MPTRPGWYYQVGEGRALYWDGEDWTDEALHPSAESLRLDRSESSEAESQSTIKRARPRWIGRVGVLAIIGAAAILAVLGVYLVVFRSLPTTVSWAPSVSAIAKGGELTVTGQITPIESGRTILVESSPNAHGPWKAMLPNI